MKLNNSISNIRIPLEKILYMPVSQSAGILLYKVVKGEIMFFLVHPGGPYWKNKDEQSWSIPKSEYDENEDPLSAAQREFFEETGQHVNASEFIPLPDVKSKSIEIEGPPRSGKKVVIPEVVKGEWFTFDDACKKNTWISDTLNYFGTKYFKKK